MTTNAQRDSAFPDALAGLLAHCSFEIAARDHSSLASATALPERGSEIFIASPPNATPDMLVGAAAQISHLGFIPVPHIVARNIAASADLDDLLARLAGEAGVDRALLLGGDRDRPAGVFDSALQLIRSGSLQRHGVKRIALACYPERHPRIPDDALRAALSDKLNAAKEAGVEATLISQFAFDAEPIIAMARRLRSEGVTAPLRVGLAGPIHRAKLFQYALRCGVGASLRVLRDRSDLARSALSGETPDKLAAAIAAAQANEPSLGVSGLHLFTFGALAQSAEWVRARRQG